MIKEFKKIFILAAMILLSTATVFSESVTLTTYYPAPFGAYDRFKLVPRDTLSTQEFCKSGADVGVLYYNNGKDQQQEGIYVCQYIGEDKTTKKDIYDWVLISRPLILQKGEPVAGKVVCIKDDGKLGTCMQNPSSDGSCGCE